MRYLSRAFLVILGTFVIVMSVMMVRDYFDRGDLDEAIRVLFSHRPKDASHKTLEVMMSEHMGMMGGSLDCQASLLSRYEGRIQVNCGTGDLSYQWIVKIPEGQITGGNKRALILLEQLEGNK